MPGARYRDFRFGDSAELLAEYILGSMAFTTRVPRQEDVGHDFFCVLAEPDGELLMAGPFFTVQTKKGAGTITYQKEYEVKWIKQQENPLFICQTNTDSLSIDLYSTWNMHTGFLAKDARKIILSPGGPEDNYEEVQTSEDNSQQIIPLGKPILHITAADTMREGQTRTFAHILREWVLMDRQNIANKHAGMHWVIGPTSWETNKPLLTPREWLTAFFWNAQNLSLCRTNFGRCATALRLTLRRAYDQERENSPEVSQEIEGLEHALKSHSKYLEPLAIQLLREQIRLDI